MVGPKENFGQLNISSLLRQCGPRPRRVKPENSTKPALDSGRSIGTEVDVSQDQLIMKAGHEGPGNNNQDKLGIVNEVADEVGNYELRIVNNDAVSHNKEGVV